MSRPNINIPTEFAVNGIKTPFTNAKIQDGFDRINPDVLAGDNLNQFIDDTYKGLNGVLELYKGAVLYDVTETYTDTSIVFYIDTNDDNKIKIYHSLQNSNMGNPLLDDTYWEEVKLGGGANRNIGEIVSSTIPLIDAGLHLLDGALIDGSGIYSAFVDYIADLYTDNPTANYFTDEGTWQATVLTYGVCGKFVYDSVANTVRLPKVTGILEGTTDLTVLGDLVEAGLPNITGSFRIGDNNDSSYWGRCWSATGAFSSPGVYHRYGNYDDGSNETAGGDVYLDASRSSSIYGNSSTVQPQTIKCYYYIVIATSTKTDIEVDIDEIATDLNGKADVDLSNVPNTSGFRKLIDIYNNGASWYKVFREYNPSDGTYIGLWCEQGGLVVAPGGVNDYVVNLLKSYKDTDYSVIISNKSNTATTTYGIAATVTSTSTFTCGIPSAVQGGYWEAKGYIS